MPTVELAACQVYIGPDDYASEERYHALLDRTGRLLSAARARGPSGAYAHDCLVVFPEMIGAFLPLAGRGALTPWVQSARSTDAALALVAMREWRALLMAMARGRTPNPKVGFLLAAAAESRRIYKSAFSRFAREHAAWVVAGSALLPQNRFGDLAERFEPLDGRVYNTSYAFSPSGELVGCVRKVNLVPTLEDRLGLSPGRAEQLLPCDTPFGKVGTLICYDGFRVAHTGSEPGFCALVQRYDARGCSIIAQPAANPWPWEAPWVFADPGESILRREQWIAEGLYSQLAEGRYDHVRYAVTSQLIGRVFDNHFDGRSHIIERNGNAAHIIAEASRADASPEAEQVVLRAVELG